LTRRGGDNEAHFRVFATNQTERERQRERQRDRETERQRHRGAIQSG
jgi:hypothetical protein